METRHAGDRRHPRDLPLPCSVPPIALAGGESLVAIEAKGGTDLLRGIVPAELYRRAFHLVLLACAGWPPQEQLGALGQRSVDVLAVLLESVRAARYATCTPSPANALKSEQPSRNSI
jgi:hypothetical protein